MVSDYGVVFTDYGWFIAEELPIADQAEFFKQGAFPKDIQHRDEASIMDFTWSFRWVELAYARWPWRGLSDVPGS